jgi:hypothetical protein
VSIHLLASTPVRFPGFAVFAWASFGIKNECCYPAGVAGSRHLELDDVVMKFRNIKIEWRIIFLTILLGLMGWLFDCWVDAYIFSKGSLHDQIFHPEIFELYIRGLIFVVFIGCGLVVARVVLRLRLSEEEKAQTIATLQLAQKEIIALRGILPICASCKKIRKDDASWHQIEGYIRDHSNVEFTHGICPDCLKNF